MLLLLVRILALVMRHVNRTFQRPFILAPAACLAVLYFSTLFHTRNDLKKKLLNLKMCVWILSTTFF